jgi:hypothetical protein
MKPVGRLTACFVAACLSFVIIPWSKSAPAAEKLTLATLLDNLLIPESLKTHQTFGIRVYAFLPCVQEAPDSYSTRLECSPSRFLSVRPAYFPHYIPA